MRRLVAVLVASCLASSPLVAQLEPAVAVGSRIRIKTAASPDVWVVGTLSRADGTSLWLDQQQFSKAAIREFEVRESSKSGLGRGLARGALLGGAVGAVWGVARGDVSDEPVTAPIMAAGGAAVGAILGGLIGAAGRVESWRRADPRRMTVALLPDLRGGAGIRLGMSF